MDINDLVSQPGFIRASVKKGETGRVILTLELETTPENGNGNGNGHKQPAASRAVDRDAPTSFPCPDCDFAGRSLSGLVRHQHSQHPEVEEIERDVVGGAAEK